MNRTRFLMVIFALLPLPGVGHGYVGPGAGLSAIGSVLGFIILVLLLLIGVLWYPLKKLIHKIRKNP